MNFLLQNLIQYIYISNNFSLPVYRIQDLGKYDTPYYNIDFGRANKFLNQIRACHIKMGLKAYNDKSEGG